ncbi:MAG: oligosaccharide flippase family protein, partial [Chloroflexota bacterium]
MSEVLVKYADEALARNERPRAAALVKGIGLTEMLTAATAYLVLLALSPWAALTFAKDPSIAPLFAVYGLFLLGNMVYETSTGVLQTFKRFDRVAAVNLVQSITTAALIGAAFIFGGGIPHVLFAYLAGKILAGITIASLAVLEMNRNLPGWRGAPLHVLTDWRGILKFAVNTNLNGTVNLIVRDSAPLFLGAFSTQTEVGYFKLALSLINLVMLPIEPFIWPTYAELTETVARQKWLEVLRLLRRVSVIAAAWTLAAGGGLAALGWWLIPLVYGADSAPAYPAAVILLLGFGFANVLHWNRPLLLALGMPSYPLIASALVGAVQIALVFVLVPRFGYLAMAALMSAYFVGSIGLIVRRGLAEVRRRAASAQAV